MGPSGLLVRGHCLAGDSRYQGAAMAPLHQQGCGTGPRPWPLLGGLAWFQEQRLHPPQCVEWCSFQTPAPKQASCGQRVPLHPAAGLETRSQSGAKTPWPVLSPPNSACSTRGAESLGGDTCPEAGQGQAGLLGPFMIGGGLEYTPGVCAHHGFSAQLHTVCV